MPRPLDRTRRTASPLAASEPSVIDRVMDLEDSTLLDVLDHVLTKGVMATGDLTLGVAGIDLIYVRISALLGAADRLLPAQNPVPRKNSKRKSSRSRTGGRKS